MVDWARFSALPAPFARTPAVQASDVLFRSGLALSSIAFAEFIKELELATGQDIDLDSLDASVETAGQLQMRLFGCSADRTPGCRRHRPRFGPRTKHFPRAVQPSLLRTGIDLTFARANQVK